MKEKEFLENMKAGELVALYKVIEATVEQREKDLHSLRKLLVIINDEMEERKTHDL